LAGLSWTLPFEPKEMSSDKSRETTMRKTIATVLAASLIAALTAQTAVASEHHRARAKSRAVATEQIAEQQCLCRTP
jgi:hypothetical protein